MTYASVRKLQGLLADEIHKVAYSSQQSSEEISSLLTTKSSMKEENRGTIKGMRLLGKIWPLDGFKVTKTARNLQKFLDPEEYHC